MNSKIEKRKKELETKIQEINNKSKYIIEPINPEKDAQVIKLWLFEKFIKERIYINFWFLKNILSKDEIEEVYASGEEDFYKLYIKLKIWERLNNKSTV